jgi:50S ribosomal protein L16 3-hydroxylase
MPGFDGADVFADAGIDGVRASFSGGEPFVVHGDRARLPAFLRDPALLSIESLAAHYRGRILHGRSEQGPRSALVTEGSVSALLAAGEALYLPDLLDVLPGAEAWLRTLETALGIPAGSARITAWMAPQGEGTALHFDAEDVISIQLVGEKCFEVAESVALPAPLGFQYGPGIPAAADLYPQAAEGFPDPTGATFTAVQMQPGSVLVQPRGYWHRTRCRTPSLSVSIILSPPSRLDWLLGLLRHRGLGVPAWRRPLYGQPTAEEALAAAEALKNLITPDLHTAEAVTLQRIPTVTLELGPPVVRVERYDGSRTPLEAPELALRIWSDLAASTAAFTVGDARLRYGAAADAALEWLVAHGCLYRWPVPRAPV